MLLLQNVSRASVLAVIDMKICIICSKSFKITPSRIKTAKYCSKTCYGKGKIGSGKFLVSVCGQCGKSIKNRKKRIYCSIQCRAIAVGNKNRRHPVHVPKIMDRAFFKKISLLGIAKQQRSKEPTSIEKKLYDELFLRRIKFKKQELINNKFLVDAFIPSLNLVIEADGDYWHALDRVKRKDKAENAYLSKCGFSILRLSEKEINDGSFKERMVF